MKYVFVVLLIALSGCVSDVRPQSAAAKQLVSAQAAATQEAMDYANATQTAAQAQQRLDESYARATEQANAAYQAQLNQINTQAQIQNATHEADVNAVMLSQAQEQATAQAVSLRATVQAIQIAQKSDYDSASATATAVSKQLENSKTSGDVYAIISMLATALVELGVPIVALVAAIIGLRKWQQKDIIQQPHPDGPAFEIKHNLLKSPEPFVIWNPFEERSKFAALPAPREQGNVELDHIPFYKGEKLVSMVDTESARELSEAELMRRRVQNFLRLVIEYYEDDPDSVIVPHWEDLKKFAESRGRDVSAGSNEWIAVTDSLEGAECISKSQGKKTLLIGKYMTFQELYAAVGQKRIPLPVVIRQNGKKTVQNSTVQYSQNSSQQFQTDIIASMPGVAR